MRSALPLSLGLAAVTVLACGARTTPGDLLDGESSGTSDAGAGAGSSSGSYGNLFGDAEVAPTPRVDGGTNPDPLSCPDIPPAGVGAAGAPEVLATLGAPAAIAVDADALYVASFHAGPVSRVALDGSGAATLDAIGSYNVALNSTSVFTPSIYGVVASCAKSGCGGDYATIVSDQAGVWGVAADESNVYFTNQYTGVWSAPVGGGAATQIAETGSNAAIALYGGELYVAAGNLMRMDPDGSHALTLYSFAPYGGTGIASLAVDCANVYFGLVDGSLDSIPVEGGDATVLATGQNTTLQLAIDQRDLYFTSSTASLDPGEKPTGYLRTVPKLGGAVRTLATFSGAPGGVAVDATYVYWANSDDGTVSRLAK